MQLKKVIEPEFQDDDSFLDYLSENPNGSYEEYLKLQGEVDALEPVVVKQKSNVTIKVKS